MKLPIETEWCVPNNVVDIMCMDNQQTVLTEKVNKTVRLIGFIIQNGFRTIYTRLEECNCYLID